MTDVGDKEPVSTQTARRAPFRPAPIHDPRDPAGEPIPTASERAYQELRHRILDGRLPSGRRLKEVALAKELGLSRTPVRDAVSRLSSEGLLDFRPNLGATVAVWSEDQIALMFRIRAILEPFAAEIAAATIADEEIAKLRELCARMEEASRRSSGRDLAVLSDANAQFHRIDSQLVTVRASGEADLPGRRRSAHAKDLQPIQLRGSRAQHAAPSRDRGRPFASGRCLGRERDAHAHPLGHRARHNDRARSRVALIATTRFA